MLVDLVAVLQVQLLRLAEILADQVELSLHCMVATHALLQLVANPLKLLLLVIQICASL